MAVAVQQRILAHLQATFSGSGDIEESDAKGYLEVFNAGTEDSLKQSFEAILARVRSFDGLWIPPPCWTSRPNIVGPPEEGWLYPWQLGFQDGACPRGRARMVSVLEVAASILEKTYLAQENPLSVVLGGNSGEPLRDFSVQISVGFTRSIAVKVVLYAVANLALTDAEFNLILPVLKSCLALKVIARAEAEPAEQVSRSLEGKFRVSESTRPDVIQLFHSLSNILRAKGLEVHSTTMIKEVHAFNERTGLAGGHISEFEGKVLKMFPDMTPGFIQALDYHWHNFKSPESAVPLKLLAQEGLFKSKPAESDMWKKVYTVTPAVAECILQFFIARFLGRLKDAQAKKKVNLRNGASKFRAPDADAAARSVCLWCYFREEFRKTLSKEDFTDMAKKFYRGSFERDFLDKIKAENPDLGMDHFRSLSLYTGRVPCPGGAGAGDLAGAQSAHDATLLALFRAALGKDIAAWESYLEAKERFDANAKQSRRQFLLAQSAAITEGAQRFCDVALPVKAFGQETGILPWVSARACTWSTSRFIARENIYTIFYIDWTKVGYMVPRFLKSAVRLIAGELAANPQKAACIMIAPNAGSHGNCWDFGAINQAQDAVETEAREEEHNMILRRAAMTFDDTNSRRVGYHPLLMLLNADGKDNIFTKSRLWNHRCIPQITPKEGRDHVVPMKHEAPTAADPANMSKAQLAKQFISGASFVDHLRHTMWRDVGLGPTHGAVWVDLTGYDDSFQHSLLQTLSTPNPKYPQELVATAVWLGEELGTGENRKRVASWIEEASVRRTKAKVSDRSLSIEGLVVEDFATSGTAPTYNTNDFQLTMPTAAGCLPLRATKLDEWGRKLVSLSSDFESTVAAHNKKYNVSGEAFTEAGTQAAPTGEGQGAGTSGEAADWPDGRAVEDPAQVVAAGAALLEVPSSQPDLVHVLVDCKGQLWIKAQADGVVLPTLSLGQVHGRFHTGEDITKARERRVALSPWQMRTADYTAVWLHPAAWTPAFERAPCPLSAFLEWLLEKKNVAEVQVVCHKITGADTPTPEPTEECMFEPLKLAARTTKTLENCGSLVDFSKIAWDTASAGDLARVIFYCNYEDTAQQCRITPYRPGIFLKAAMRVKKGWVYRVI